MVQCLCPSPQHTDPTGCIIVHDGELGEVCQICYKHHQPFIQGLNLIQCRHRKIKVESSFDENTGQTINNYYCRICKTYLPTKLAEQALLDQITTLRIETANLWHPDTCDCKIEFAYDHDNPDEAKVYSRTVKGCPDHANLKGQQFLDIMTDENSRKNILQNDLVLDSLFGEDVLINGQTIRQFKAGISFDWSFTGQDDTRILHVTISGITLNAGQKIALQNIADAKFGVDKVVFD